MQLEKLKAEWAAYLTTRIFFHVSATNALCFRIIYVYIWTRQGDQVEIARFIRDAVANELKKSQEEAQDYMRTVSEPKLALVIDGKCLMYALDPSLRVLLLNLSLNCSSVVCCRVSPLQKAQVKFTFVIFCDTGWWRERREHKWTLGITHSYSMEIHQRDQQSKQEHLFFIKFSK